MMPVAYMGIGYPMTGQPKSWTRFWMLIMISSLMSLTSQGIGESASAVFMNDTNTAVAAGGAVMLPLILFGGFLVKVIELVIIINNNFTIIINNLFNN